MKNKLKKGDMVFNEKSQTYQGTFFQNFSIEEAHKCTNLWKEEDYENIILTKAYKMYATYVRKGTQLIGVGEPIGLLSFFSGNAYRGMGALGCSFNRSRGVGVTTKENLLVDTLKQKGLVEKIKTIRKKDLTTNNYTLVMKVFQSVSNNESTRHLLDAIGLLSKDGSNNESTRYWLDSIGLLGEDGSFIDLTSDWSTRLTENLS